MFIGLVKVAVQFDEVETILKDKTDFHKRLNLIKEIKTCADPRSIEALQYSAKNDYVFQVRLAAWNALTERGINCVKPVARPRYAVVLETTIERIQRYGKWLMDITQGFR